MSRRLATPKTAGAAARFGHRRNPASARHCSARWCRPLRLLRAQARTRASQSLFAQQICWDEPTPRLPSTKSRRPTAILRHPSEWMVAAYCAALFASDYLAPQAVRPHSFSMQPRYANSDRQNDTPQKCLPVDNGLMNRSLESCTKLACSTSPRFAASHSKAPLIAKICHSARNCAERQISIRHASLAHQPAVHDLPLVLTSWSKIQKRRSRLLQLKKEFKRIPGARRLGIDGLRLDPSVPLPDNQRLRVLLSHPTHARSNDELSTCEDGQRSGK